MSSLLLALPLGQESVAEEGRRIIIVMLLVALTFLGVVALGQLSRWLAHRRQARRAARRRVY
ncbi:MAG: hypothetical protein M3123_02150 [Actinomycetota bacterium]|nr:hypothetical protein [Actinomycetota bacterium]